LVIPDKENQHGHARVFIRVYLGYRNIGLSSRRPKDIYRSHYTASGIRDGFVYHRGIQGQPDWRKLHDIPAPSLTVEEQAFLDGPVNEVCRMVNDYQVTHELADLPPEVWQYLKDHKFFAMIIKKRYGFRLCSISRTTKTNWGICCTLFHCRRT